MGVYFGQSGEIVLKRDSLQSALETKLDPFDVNVGGKRFSVDHSSGSLISGDQIEIATVDNSTLELVSGHSYPDGKWFVNVDPMGGLRLYDTFSKSIGGSQAEALTLVAPSSAKNILIKTKNDTYRHVANIQNFEMTTTREQVDLTNLGDEFKNNYEAGLISGQGSMDCIWEHNYDTGNRKNEYGGDPEFTFYLAQLIIRTQQGSDFDGRFYIYREPGNAVKNLYYEATCMITNIAVSVSASEVVETRIEFVTNGIVRLKTGGVAGYLLQEGASGDKILQEDESPIVTELLEED